MHRPLAVLGRRAVGTAIIHSTRSSCECCSGCGQQGKISLSSERSCAEAPSLILQSAAAVDRCTVGRANARHGTTGSRRKRWSNRCEQPTRHARWP